MTRDVCLTEQQIEAFLESPSDNSVIGRHFENCRHCLSLLNEYRANNDFVHNLRELTQEYPVQHQQRPVGTKLLADSVPGYEILNELHRGGQGVVYRAMQTATKRVVALKVLLQGSFATSRQRRRFEREVDVVAGLRHPNIVTVYDSGCTVDGKMYYAMEYIDGVSVDAYVAGQSWRDPREMLPLFAEIAYAVNYAHQRGVIHRDLKPSNILVDDGGQPHIVDFGLAKAADRQETVAVTVSGEFMGTLAYASPEQAQGDSASIDLRTDIYSLGVLMYGTLTGRFPYNVQGHLKDVLEAITHQEAVALSAHRADIDGELETIVLKLLAKQPQRRYQSAGDLARDLEHYLAGEPIDAKRDSTWYLFCKTVQRHRVPVAVGLVFLFLLLAFGITMTILYRGKVVAESLARQRLLDMGRQAQTTSQVNKYLQGILALANPGQSRGPNMTVLELLQRAAQRMDTELVHLPTVEADIRGVIGETYFNLGRYDQAQTQLRRALELSERSHEEPHEQVARSLDRLALPLLYTGQYAEAKTVLRRAVDIWWQLNDHELEYANSLTTLARVYRYNREHIDAIDLYRQALEIKRSLYGDKHPHVAEGMNSIATALIASGRLDLAEPLLVHAIDVLEKAGPSARRSLAIAIANRARIYVEREQYVTARELAERGLAIRAEIFGPEHNGVVLSLQQLARIDYFEGKLDSAERTTRKALDIMDRLGGGKPNRRTRSLYLLGCIAADRGDLTTAEAPLWRAYQLVHPGSKRFRLELLPRLARVLLDLHKPHQARLIIDEYDQLCRSVSPENPACSNEAQ